MPYLLLLLVALMWSFVGILVKYASFMVDSWTITFCRFFFGVIFLALLLRYKKEPVTFYWQDKWIWIAAIGKCVNYIFENIAIAIGFAYGNVIVQPVQAVFLCIVSALYFSEEMHVRKILAIILCVVGVMFVNWKGAPLTELFHSNIITILFTIAAIGAGIHVMGQKILLHRVDSANMNFSIFLISSCMSAIPLPFTFHTSEPSNAIAIFSLIALGFITGISFYLNAIVLKEVPLVVSAIITNCSVLFTLLWAWIFFNEPINIYIISGALIFIAGVLLLSIPRKLPSAERTA